MKINKRNIYFQHFKKELYVVEPTDKCLKCNISLDKFAIVGSYILFNCSKCGTFYVGGSDEN